MKSMTLMPMAVADAIARPRPWSAMTAGTAIHPAANGFFKANGTRRLWEPST